MAAYRKKRKTFDIYVDFLPNNVQQKEVSKRFTPFGEIQSIYLKNGNKPNTKTAVVKFLCEPDAVKAISETNGQMWDRNIIVVKRECQMNTPPLLKNPENKQNMNMAMGKNHYPTAPPRNYMHPCRPMVPLPNMPGHIIPRVPGRSNPGIPFPYFNVMHPPPHMFPSSPYYDMNSKPFMATPEERYVQCTVVISANSFYCQMPDKQFAFENLSADLQIVCSSLRHLQKSPELNKLYVVLYKGDGMWYRCKVKKIKSPKLADVHFVDYGNLEEVENCQMVEAPESFSLAMKPALAFKCVLVNLVPSPPKDEDNPKEAIYFLEEMILGQNLAITTSSSFGSQVFEVTKCFWKDEDLCEILVKKMFATYRPTPPPVKNVDKSHASPANPQLFNNFLSKERLQSASSTDSSSQSPINNSSTPKPTPVSQVRILQRPPADATGSQINLAMQLGKLNISCAGVAETPKSEVMEIQKKNEVAAESDTFSKLNSIATHLLLVNSIRSSRLNGGEKFISEVFAFLQVMCQNYLLHKQNLRKLIEKATKEFNSSLRAISECQNKDLLHELITNKNNSSKVVNSSLSQYLAADQSNEREIISQKLKEYLAELKNKKNTSADLRLRKVPASLEHLVQEYEYHKVSRNKLSENAQNNTDAAHRAFIDSITMLQKSFTLWPYSKESGANPLFVRFEDAMKTFKSAVSLLQDTLDREVNSVYTVDPSEKVHVVECLMKEVKHFLAQIEEEAQFRETIKLQLNSCNNGKEYEPLIVQVVALRKQIKSVKSKLRHTLVDKKDLEEMDPHDDAAIEENNMNIINLQMELHRLFIEEDVHLKDLSQFYKTTSPELDLEYPEMGLLKFSKSFCTIKQGWELDHFSLRKLSNCLVPTYESQFVGTHVFIKEFLLENEEKSSLLMQRVLSWNGVQSKYAVPVIAMFEKSSIQMCVITPRLPRLEDFHERQNTAQQCALFVSVLEALQFLHCRDVVHGALHPSNILLNDGSVSFDFAFHVNGHSNGADNHQVLDVLKYENLSKASDMFAFGYLVFSALFPQLQIKVIASCFPVIDSFKPIMEKQLSIADYLALKSLLSKDAQQRPSAKHLLQTGFLKMLPTTPPQATPVEPQTATNFSSHTESMLNRMCSLRQPLNSHGKGIAFPVSVPDSNDNV